MIRVIAVDDEPLALRQLESYISKVPFLELVASCSDAFQALHALQENKVDAMFADINMPELSGMDLVRSLDNPPLVVFTTAYSEHAIDGFRVNAVDYLLKPFGLDDFIRAAEKIRARMAPAPASEEDSLFFKADYRTVRVRPGEIRYVESMSEYVKIHIDGTDRPLLVLLSLKSLMEQLPAGAFMRIHRSYIIALDRLREASKSEVTLDDGTVLPIGEMYRQEFREYLNGLSTANSKRPR
ncbi:MAG: response regulator transcription factor [Bacteroidales bacterium]|nr:response regulator transcription factor [Bacteroidales bacterium]